MKRTCPYTLSLTCYHSNSYCLERCPRYRKRAWAADFRKEHCQLIIITKVENTHINDPGNDGRTFAKEGQVSIPLTIAPHGLLCTIDSLDGLREILHEDFQRVLLWLLTCRYDFEEVQ